MLRGFDDKRAHALCTFAFCAGPGQTPEVFEGRCEGRIVPARGPSNFGWDPVFEVEGAGKTCVPVLLLRKPPPMSVRASFAEMTSEEKNAISHRSRVRLFALSHDQSADHRQALAKLREFLQARAG
jgi:inosine triphosphate pyrophosphatase